MTSPIYHTTALIAPGLKQASIPHLGRFRDLDDKAAKLLPTCGPKNIVGLPAGELLRAGGDRHLMWVDVDSRDHDAVERWLHLDRPFPPGSFVAVPSSTLKWHVYVVTHRALEDSECIGMWEHLISTIADPGLRVDLDRVYGPTVTDGMIYVPGAARGKPQLPQHLCRDLPSVFTIPDGLERGSKMEWTERKRALRANPQRY